MTDRRGRVAAWAEAHGIEATDWQLDAMATFLDPYPPERFELIQRLNTRWRDGQDPGLPARVKQAMRGRS